MAEEPHSRSLVADAHQRLADFVVTRIQSCVHGETSLRGCDDRNIQEKLDNISMPFLNCIDQRGLAFASERSRVRAGVE